MGNPDLPGRVAELHERLNSLDARIRRAEREEAWTAVSQLERLRKVTQDQLWEIEDLAAQEANDPDAAAKLPTEELVVRVVDKIAALPDHMVHLVLQELQSRIGAVADLQNDGGAE